MATDRQRRRAVFTHEAPVSEPPVAELSEDERAELRRIEAEAMANLERLERGQRADEALED